jgi:hypothetical protein
MYVAQIVIQAIRHPVVDMPRKNEKARIFNYVSLKGTTSSDETGPTVMKANSPGKHVAISATHGTS